MQLGAHLAGIAIEHSMLGATHACANPLTAHYGITHGAAIAALLPHVVRWNHPSAGDLYRELDASDLGHRLARMAEIGGPIRPAAGARRFERGPARFGRRSRHPVDRTVQSETIRRRGGSGDLRMGILKLQPAGFGLRAGKGIPAPVSSELTELVRSSSPKSWPNS